MLWAGRNFTQNVAFYAPPDGSGGSFAASNRHVVDGFEKSPQGGPEAASEARLGTKRQLFDPPPGEGKQEQSPPLSKNIIKTRINVAADQRQAARIYYAKSENLDAESVKALPGRGVCLCGWTQIADMDTDLMRVRNADHWHSYVTGRQMCGLRWVCPICTAKRAEEDRRAVNDGMAAARQRGLYPVMMTLTTRHFKKEDAQTILDGILFAEQKIKDRKTWRKMHERGQIVGYARVLEWTYGKRGHHPHFHTLLLVRANSEAEAIALAERLREPYMQALHEVGRDGTSAAAWRHSFQVQGASAAENYITKWGAAEELTGAQVKTAKGEGLTIWALLRLARTAEATPRRTATEERARFGAIWWDIVRATKGKAQLYKSSGWKELVEAWRAEQPEPEPEPEPEKVKGFGVREKHGPASQRFVEARAKLLAVRQAAESIDDLSAARRAVDVAIAFGPTDYEMIDQAEEDPPDEMIELIDQSPGWGDGLSGCQ